jgi:hypothetical protein
MREYTYSCKLCNKKCDSENESLLVEKGYCSYRCLEYDEIRQMINAGIKDEGYRHYRTMQDRGDREKILIEHWKKENEARPGINFGFGLLQDLFMESSKDFIQRARATLVIEPRDRYVAATVIQWLGTNVGFCFLQEAVEKMGYWLIYKDRMTKLDERPYRNFKDRARDLLTELENTESGFSIYMDNHGEWMITADDDVDKRHGILLIQFLMKNIDID